jgi:hypothetical protein
MEKIIHLWLQSGLGDKKTLICGLKNNAIRYVFYGGTADGGTPYSLNNLQCRLPIEPNEDESMEDFGRRIKGIINKDSVYNVIHEVKPVKFKNSMAVDLK